MNEHEGLRTLVLEDNALLAIMIQDMLEDMGCIVRSCHDIPSAIEVADGGEIDFAILDLDVGGEFSWPVAEALEARKTPFLFATGFAGEALPARVDPSRVLEKPFLAEELDAAITRTLELAGR